jgi:hypothetical protein
MLKRILKDDTFAQSDAGQPNAPADEIMIRVIDNFYQYVEFYVTCFCTSGDLLGQWREYAREGGYAIGFEPPSLHSGVLDRLALRQVIYDQDQQRSELCELARRWRSTFVDPPKIEEDRPAWRAGEFVFAQSFAMVTLAYKNPAFREEQEWRLIYIKQQIIPDDGINLSIDYRARRGVPISYARIPLGVPDSSRPFPISEIVKSPRHYSNVAGYAVGKFLASLGVPLGSLSVRDSEVPLRT